MVEINPEMARIIVDLVLMLGSAILGSYLTYIYAIKEALKERVLTERIALYRPLIHDLASLIDFTPDDWNTRAKELQDRLNQHRRELMLYAPSNVYRAFIKAIDSVKKGAKAEGLVEFMLTLRKELIGKSDLSIEDVVSIELRP